MRLACQVASHAVANSICTQCTQCCCRADSSANIALTPGYTTCAGALSRDAKSKQQTKLRQYTCLRGQRSRLVFASLYSSTRSGLVGWSGRPVRSITCDHLRCSRSMHEAGENLVTRSADRESGRAECIQRAEKMLHTYVSESLIELFVSCCQSTFVFVASAGLRLRVFALVFYSCALLAFKITPEQAETYAIFSCRAKRELD